MKWPARFEGKYGRLNVYFKVGHKFEKEIN
jgi:hypothetical protein